MDNAKKVSSDTNYLSGKFELGQRMLLHIFCRVFLDKLVIFFKLHEPMFETSAGSDVTSHFFFFRFLDSLTSPVVEIGGEGGL